MDEIVLIVRHQMAETRKGNEPQWLAMLRKQRTSAHDKMCVPNGCAAFSVFKADKIIKVTCGFMAFSCIFNLNAQVYGVIVLITCPLY